MKLSVAEIFTICTGYLYTKNLIEGVYIILDGLLNENLMTHHLPPAWRFCSPQIIKQLPEELQTIINNWKPVDNWQELINNYQNQFGDINVTIDKSGFGEYMIENSLFKSINRV